MECTVSVYIGAWFSSLQMILPDHTGQPTPETVLKQTQDHIEEERGHGRRVLCEGRQVCSWEPDQHCQPCLLGRGDPVLDHGHGLVPGKHKHDPMDGEMQGCPIGATIDEVYKKVYQVRDSKTVFGKLEFY